MVEPLPKLSISIDYDTLGQLKEFCSEKKMTCSSAFHEVMDGWLDESSTYKAAIKNKNIQGSRSSKRNNPGIRHTTIHIKDVSDEMMEAFDDIVQATTNVASQSAVVDYILRDRLKRHKLNAQTSLSQDEHTISQPEQEQFIADYFDGKIR